MKKIKYVAFLLVLFIIPFSVNAEEIDRDKLINSIVPDGVNLTYKGIKPSSYEEAYSMIGVIASKLDQTAIDEGYEAYGDCNPNDFTDCIIDISDGQGWQESYNITITYDEPSTSDITKYSPIINGFLNSFEVDFMDTSTYFKVEDLSLVNYFLTGDKSELWNLGAASRAIKFSNANDYTGGADITYDLAIGLGEQGEDLMYETAGGGMTIYYDGYAYAYTFGGVYLRRVIYIPESTNDDPDSYITAAKQRIDSYLGNNDVTISLGGALNTLDQDALDEFVDVNDTDGNYYNIKIGNRTYKFYIIKSSNIPEKPVYKAKNIDTKIVITSTDSSIPLDTSISAKVVNFEDIKELLDTNNFISYNIALFSSAKNTLIEELDNGKFLVTIPVPDDLKGKTLTVYYLTSENKLEEHEVTVNEDGTITFETNHFSTYTIAEKIAATNTEQNNDSNTNTENTQTNTNQNTTTNTQTTTDKTEEKEEVVNDTTTTQTSNPKTGDNVMIYASILVICVVGISGIFIYKKVSKK